jgi:hypothetical protein
MSYSDSSQLLNKQAELKALQAKYDSYTSSYKEIASTSSTNLPNNKNAISSTNPPPGVRAGEDFGEYWKFISGGGTTAAACWTSATRDPRIFQKVVYTGENNDTSTATNNGDATWNDKCYGLVWNAPTQASYSTNAPGYSTMVSDSGNIGGKGVYYTKSGITTIDNLNEATQMADIKSRIDTLTEEIAIVARSSINSELTDLTKTSSDKMSVIQKINDYMNTSAGEIAAGNSIIDKRKNMNNVYEDINKQITLTSRKFKFMFYFFIGIVVIISYMSYASKLTVMEQIGQLSNVFSVGWWTNWGVITFVVILLLLSSFGWDMKGNILMIWRYISDPDFWTGQMWWVGVSFLFLIVIFLHATFKSFFADSLAQLEKLGNDKDDSE